MAVRRALRRVIAVLGALVLVGGVPLVAAAEDKVAFTITDSRITESSGLARDPDAAGYWTVNDSGSGPVAYALDPDGQVTGTLRYRADPVDVEAVAMYDGRLYVADIGDNGAERDAVTVYYFDDAAAGDQPVSYRSWDFRYPDGARDAETLLVDERGRLYIVTKGAEGGVYRAPLKPARTRVNVLDRVGDAPAAVTDGTFLPGGDRIALLTYGAVEVLDATSYERVGDAPIPAQSQPESLSVSLDGTSLLVGSEGERSVVYEVPVPGAGSATPTATPGGEPEPDPEPSEETAEGEAATGQSRARTLLALGLAALVAIMAGSVVTMVKR